MMRGRSRQSWWLLATVLLLAVAGGSHAAAAQDGGGKVRRIYLEPFPAEPGSEALQADVADRLKALHGVELVSSRQTADGVLTGAGETWVQGYVTDSTRAPNRQAVESGYLSLALKTPSGQTLWSYMVTPSRMHWSGVEHDMADHIVRLLGSALATLPEAGAAPAATAATQVSLAGAGATFPAPLYQEWIQAFEAQRPGVNVTYQALGSEQGLAMLASGKVDFAASDVLPQDAGGDAKLVSYATVLGAVVPAYNLPPTARDLRFTPELLAAIYLGKITRWNDPQLRAVNHGASLPDLPIAVVHRADGSGTTFAFTSYLAATEPEWRPIGSGLHVAFPVGKAAEGNEGLAAAIASTPGAIGYVELTYALRHRLSFGLVRNAAGSFVQANLASLNAAAASAPAAAPSLINSPGRDAYPITTFTWIVLPAADADAQKTEALREMLRWMLTAGQKECSALGYLPLPRELAARELGKLGP